MKKHLLLFFVFFGLLTYAHAGSDSPDANEIFLTFFARITRGGKFTGIYLTPSV